MATKDLIVVPVHENKVHWCVMAIHIPSKTIFYMDRFDSLLNMSIHPQSTGLLQQCNTCHISSMLFTPTCVQ